MITENNMPCRVKMIFSDIDGTLLDSSHQVTDGTRNKIIELEQKGIPFVLVSARMPEGVVSIQRQIGNHSPIISYSGGLIHDANRRILYSCLLELDKALTIKEVLEREFPQICCNTYGYEKWIVDNAGNPWVRREEKITGLNAAEGDIKKEFVKERGIHKFLLMGEAEEIHNVEIWLRKDYPELSIALSNENYLEVMHGSVKKSAGISYLCNYRGISLEEAMAFGDGHNDIDMLKAVKYSYAMGNAPKEVKESAVFVTLDNDHEGVLAVIKELN
ncbi:Cof-type HAD-IIB family hydrolase [Lacrimispora brassicae]